MDSPVIHLNASNEEVKEEGYQSATQSSIKEENERSQYGGNYQSIIEN